MWEIEPAGSEVRVLRSRLGLDSGYLSRQLRRLEADGLVTTGQGAEDGRVRTVRLTSAGVAERALLDRASDELAESPLAPLGVVQRDRLVAAMAEVERLLLAAQARIELSDPRAHGSPVGCGALKLHPETGIAEIKRMWTAPQARGLGLGRRILECAHHWYERRLPAQGS